MNLRDLLEQHRYDEDFIYEGLVLDLSYALKKIMEEKGITKKQLAEKMGVSPAYITKIFKGSNISLRTVAKILAALEVDARINLLFDDDNNSNYKPYQFKVSRVNKKDIKRAVLNESEIFIAAA